MTDQIINKKYYISSLIIVFILFSGVAGFSINPEFGFVDGGNYIYEHNTDADIIQNGNDIKLKIEGKYNISVKEENGNFKITVLSLENEVKDTDLTDFNVHNIGLLKKGEKWIGLYDNKGKLLKEIYKSSITPFIIFISFFPDYEIELNKPKNEKYTYHNIDSGFINQEMGLSLQKTEKNLFWIENILDRRSPSGNYIEDVRLRFVYDSKIKRLIRGTVISKNVIKEKGKNEEYSTQVDWTLKSSKKETTEDKIDW